MCQGMLCTGDSVFIKEHFHARLVPEIEGGLCIHPGDTDSQAGFGHGYLEAAQ